jgi:hypothetical protein
MGAGYEIFSRQRLTPAALRTVAERRFEDAAALRDTKKNARANGSMYLAGFVIECLLKAQLLVEYRWLENGSPAVLKTDDERELWSLCYRSHDLDEIFARLPRLRDTIDKVAQRDGRKPSELLKEVCAEWTILARYSTRQADGREAHEFLEKVRELKGYIHA